MASINTIASAWYTPDTWRELETAIAKAGLPKDTLCASYRIFVANWERYAKEFERQGIKIEKQLIDVAHMTAWCERWGLSLDSRGRATYGSALAAAEGDCAILDSRGFEDRTRTEH